MRRNSTIYKNPEDQYLFDITALGVFNQEQTEIRLTQKNHYFRVGDALYYDPQSVKFIKAVANNSIASEVCGIVSRVVDMDTFILVTQGELEVSRYQYNEGSTLYLSEFIEGQLTTVQPLYAIKPLGYQIEPGKILVDIQRGLVLSSRPPAVDTEELEPYSQAELDEIILNIKSM